jgi:alpha-beta hydrolase superfamily lysophospholipase
MWLRDFVPQTMPSARILSFGYDSAYVLSNSVADIDDAARSLIDRLDGERQEDRAKQRPIIFVAHSLGGIVVKRVSASHSSPLS